MPDEGAGKLWLWNRLKPAHRTQASILVTRNHPVSWAACYKNRKMSFLVYVKISKVVNQVGNNGKGWELVNPLSGWSLAHASLWGPFRYLL